MVNAKNWLTEEGRKEIENRIQQAETETTCEFVCAVASRSSAYHKAASWWGLLGACIGLLLAGTVSHLGHDSGNWDYLQSISFFPALVGLVLGFLLLHLSADHFPALLTMFVKKSEMAQAVERSAAYLFGKHKVSHTQERNGVLIYLSLSERNLVVLADRGAAEALGTEGLEKLKKTGTEALAQGEREKAIIKTLEEASNLLKEQFPGSEQDSDELQNQVLSIHPYP